MEVVPAIFRMAEIPKTACLFMMQLDNRYFDDYSFFVTGPGIILICEESYFLYEKVLWSLF